MNVNMLHYMRWNTCKDTYFAINELTGMLICLSTSQSAGIDINSFV